jgi:DNA repair photolyase
MRWGGQQVSADGVGSDAVLPGMSGLLRSVRTPEFAGMVFHEVEARSALNRVPGEALPFSWTVNPYRGCSHACAYCLVGETPVLCADGRQRPIGELRPGEEVYGTARVGAYRRFVRTEILAHWRTRKPAYRVTLADGTELVASGDHRFLTGRGWKHVTGAMCGRTRRPHLTLNDSLLGVGHLPEPPADTPSYRRGYLTGRRPLSAIGNSTRAGHAAVSELIRWPSDPDVDWSKGYLAGLFDAEGGCSRGILRISSTDPEILGHAGAALRRFGFRFTEEELPGRNVRVLRLLGGQVVRARFMQQVDPAISRKRALDGDAIKNDADLRVVAIEPLGLDLPMVDITTGTGDFIADGVVSHNCFARNTHTYLDLDPGEDFNRQVVVKVNVARVLRRELAGRRWAREPVAMGTNTDPYQRAEGRYRLMPGIIAALSGSGTPFSVLTKGTLLARDLPLLAAASADVHVGVGVSIALDDRELQSSLEPGTPSPAARLELVRRITDAGLPCTVMVAPVLPLLTDSTEALDRLLGRIAAAGARGATVLALHLRPGTRDWFMGWLAATHPALVEPYRRLYRRGSYVDPRYREALAGRVGPLLRRHGLAGAAVRQDGGSGRDGGSGTAGRGSDGGDGPASSGGEQLALL